MIMVLAGGVGAARFLSGLIQVVNPADVVAVVNTGDDTELHGLSISPDIDTADTKSLSLKRRRARGAGCKTDTAFGG